MLEHGGRLRAAAQRYGIAREHWLDLSTGISPWSWIAERDFVPPCEAWSRLPEDDDGLDAAARAYYGAEMLAVAGSQTAIQTLPTLRATSRVGVLTPGYAEHAQAWQRAGHLVVTLGIAELQAQLAALDVVVLARPNNPDGLCLSRDTLLAMHAALAARGGWLVVDEAFIDAEAQCSLAPDSTHEGLVVLRSLGKFFGLAGARVGFVGCQARLRAALREALGPWTVSGPARLIATTALADRDWQSQQRARLQQAGTRLTALLARHGWHEGHGCALFQWRRARNAAVLHEALARHGVLTRLFTAPSSLRFGLPPAEADWQRLQTALSRCSPLQQTTADSRVWDSAAESASA